MTRSVLSLFFVRTAKLLDPFRPTRKFSQPRPLEDEVDAVYQEKKAARAERLNAVPEEKLDEIAAVKKKAQREAAAK